MEDVLALYAQPYDARFPVVCFDESPYHLMGDVRHPLAPFPGRLQRYDYHYPRNGTCTCLFVTITSLGVKHYLDNGMDAPALNGIIVPESK